MSDDQYGLPATQVFNPFHFRPRTPLVSYEHFGHDEIELLRSAGFRRSHRELLASRPDNEVRFVLTNAPWLQSSQFSPDDVLATARLAPGQRDFVARECFFLAALHFTPGEMNDLALMRDSYREFVCIHGANLQAMGFSALEMMFIAMRPAVERRFVAAHGMQLHREGLCAAEIRLQARDPLARQSFEIARRQSSDARSRRGPDAPPRRRTAPARIDDDFPPTALVRTSRRVRTTEIEPAPAITDAPQASRPVRERHRQRPAASSRRRDSAHSDAPVIEPIGPAEQERFELMGLAQEALDRLSLSSGTARTYMLEYGENLLASGVAFDEIMHMAEDISGGQAAPVEDRRANRHRRQSQVPDPWRASDVPPARRPLARATTGPDDVSYLTAEDIVADGSFAHLQDIPERTSSPVHLEPAAASHPRNEERLSNDERQMLRHAHRRWADRMSVEQGESFYRDIAPATLTRKIAQDNRADLSLLLGGLAYAQDNQHRRTASAHKARVKEMTDYLVNADDADLLYKCDRAAAEGVTHCGDRVAYGLTRVEQVVIAHKVEAGLMTPRQMFESKQSLFVQPRVEHIAACLANARKIREEQRISIRRMNDEQFAEHIEEAISATYRRQGSNGGDGGNAGGGGFTGWLARTIGNPFGSSASVVNGDDADVDNSASESLEMYAALAPILRQRGISLVEAASTSTYGGMYGDIQPVEITYAENQINRHVRDLSDEYLQEFVGNGAVEMILRRRFQDDFRAMKEDRENAQEQVDEAMFDPNAADGTQATVREAMTALASMEQEWYLDKLKVVLRQPGILENLPPLAADLVD
ncbi:hypothetical protein [Herbaspirillum sp. YR522]|uniref:hypothetical protein n=1 Tax=Herbaspirillum sp. YR522 TaxID=1144342 RepID=UPI0012FB63F8|nr:hypothetical protein [Herbaspirillum sp. YR522]